jgi:hypothetical protein
MKFNLDFFQAKNSIDENPKVWHLFASAYSQSIVIAMYYLMGELYPGPLPIPFSTPFIF